MSGTDTRKNSKYVRLAYEVKTGEDTQDNRIGSVKLWREAFLDLILEHEELCLGLFLLLNSQDPCSVLYRYLLPSPQRRKKVWIGMNINTAEKNVTILQ